MPSDANTTPAAGGLKGQIQRVLTLSNDSREKTLVVAVALCLVCSILVSGAAVLLKPQQTTNRDLDRKRNILVVAGLLESGTRTAKRIEDVYAQRIEPRVVDLSSGKYSETIDPASYDQRKASKDPDRSIRLPPEEDIAGIKRRANHAEVFLVKTEDGQGYSSVIVPVHGYGLWSTLYGFISLEGDGRTIKGLRFYQHAETPGLGGEVDNPRWLSQWEGKLAYDEEGKARIEVIKGAVEPGTPNAEYKVDGLAGATLTARGVSNLVQFWLSDQGLGKYLANVRKQGISHG